MSEWDNRFLGLARHIAEWSKDPSTKCGAVVVRPDKTIASIGFNGFPKGTSDHPDLYYNRELKYLRVVHAEQNAIVHATESLKNFTIYTTHAPCSDCAGLIIQSGISKVKYPTPSDDFLKRWAESNTQAQNMFEEANVEKVSI